MPYDLLPNSCVRLSDYSGLIELSVGLNLALPLLRELAIIPRGPLLRQIAAFESLLRLRKFEDDAGSKLRGQIEAIKREMILADDELRKWINVGAVITTIFALSAVYWAFYAAADQSCLGVALSSFIAAVHFLPLPLGVFALYVVGASKYDGINRKVEAIRADVLS